MVTTLQRRAMVLEIVVYGKEPPYLGEEVDAIQLLAYTNFYSIYGLELPDNDIPEALERALRGAQEREELIAFTMRAVGE